MLLSCLPKRLFSLELAIDLEPVEVQIPRMYLERFSLRLAQLGASEPGRFIVAEPKEPPSVISARNLVNAVRKVDTRPVAICWDAMDIGFMHALSSEGIAYIRDERNAFLPFMGAVISDEALGASPAAPLSSQSQVRQASVAIFRKSPLLLPGLSCGMAKSACCPMLICRPRLC